MKDMVLERNEQNTTQKRGRGMVGWSIIGIILLASLPLLTNYCLYGTELYYQLNRIEVLKDSLQQGHLALREGSLFLLLPAVLRMFGMSVQTSYKTLLMLTNVATVVLAYYSFHRIFKDKVIGILGSIFYAWAPYHFSILYCSASLGESIAYAFLPLVLVGLYEIYTTETGEKIGNRTWITLAIAYTGMVQANVLSFLVAAGFTVLVCILRIKKTFKVQTLLALVKTVLAFGIVNSWYLLILAKGIAAGTGSTKFYIGGMIQEKGVYLAHYFLTFFYGGHGESFKDNGMQGTAPLGIGFVLTVCMLVYLWMLFVGKYKGDKKEATWGFTGTLTVAGAIVMVLSTNSFPWDFLRVYNGLFAFLTNLLQSPAKLIPLVIVCFAFVSCVVVVRLKENLSAYYGYILAIVIGIALVTSQFLVGDILSSNERLDIVATEDIPAVENIGSEYLP